MHSDPIVEEVHRIRVELASKFNYDIAAIFADMRSRETETGDRLKNQQLPAKNAAAAKVNSAAPLAATTLTAKS